jgi:hypothetical protein
LAPDLVDQDFKVLRIYLEKYDKEKHETLTQHPDNIELYKFSVCTKYGEVLNYDSTINNKK